MNHIFVVLGVPRGGTSVISRGLKTLGIDLGDKLTPANREWNPRGFWEDNEIVYKVNARVLSVLGGSWDSVTWFDGKAMTDDRLRPLKTFAGNLLQQRFSDTQYWGFKDPNTVKILPFWQEVFNQLHIQDHYVIALRNPLSSAQSYHKLTGRDIEHGLFIWLMHMLAAIKNTQGKKRTVVSYDLLIHNPHLQLDRIKKELSIPMQLNESELDAFANQFLDNKLQHYQANDDDLVSHPAMLVSPLCLKIYILLLKVANDEVTLNSDEFASSWLAIENDFEKMSPIYSYINTLILRNHLANKSLQSLHKSRLWKMIYPLRKIDDALRARRKRLKQRKYD